MRATTAKKRGENRPYLKRKLNLGGGGGRTLGDEICQTLVLKLGGYHLRRQGSLVAKGKKSTRQNVSGRRAFLDQASKKRALGSSSPVFLPAKKEKIGG